MARYIDADALTAYIKEKHCDKCEQKRRCFYCAVDDALMLLEEADDADVEEVVRCKDCKYWQDNNGGYPHEECRWGKEETPDADDFCSYGERKEK